jgi:hypothetical protein
MKGMNKDEGDTPTDSDVIRFYPLHPPYPC